MTTTEVAWYLDCSARYVRKLTERSRPRPLPCEWTNGRRVFAKPEVKAWFDERSKYFSEIEDRAARKHEEARLLRQARIEQRLQRRAVAEAARKAAFRADIASKVQDERLIARWAERGWL